MITLYSNRDIEQYKFKRMVNSHREMEWLGGEKNENSK